MQPMMDPMMAAAITSAVLQMSLLAVGAWAVRAARKERALIEVRLARFFLAAARQKGELKPGAKIVIDLPISQSELALLIGASRPKVNAALALLEDSGAIERKESRFTCDIDELEATAGA